MQGACHDIYTQLNPMPLSIEAVLGVSLRCAWQVRQFVHEAVASSSTDMPTCTLYYALPISYCYLTGQPLLGVARELA